MRLTPATPAVSQSEIQVRRGFTGTELLLYGAILDPRGTWADKAEYDRTAEKLVQLFIDNFEEFAAHVDQGVRDAAPRLVVAA